MATSAFNLGSSDTPYLYKDGYQNTGKTGGWKSVPSYNTQYRGGTAAFQADGVYFNSSGSYCPGISTIHKIDITNVKWIVAVFESDSSSTDLRISLSDNGEYCGTYLRYADSRKKIFYLDVSDISGDRYVQILYAANGYTESNLLKRVMIIE